MPPENGLWGKSGSQTGSSSVWSGKWIRASHSEQKAWLPQGWPGNCPTGRAGKTCCSCSARQEVPWTTGHCALPVCSPSQRGVFSSVRAKQSWATDWATRRYSCLFLPRKIEAGGLPVTTHQGSRAPGVAHCGVWGWRGKQHRMSQHANPEVGHSQGPSPWGLPSLLGFSCHLHQQEHSLIEKTIITYKSINGIYKVLCDAECQNPPPKLPAIGLPSLLPCIREQRLRSSRRPFKMGSR